MGRTLLTTINSIYKEDIMIIRRENNMEKRLDIEYWANEVRFQLEERGKTLPEEKIEQIAENLIYDEYMWEIINEQIGYEIDNIQ